MRLTDRELEELARGGESDLVEFKPSPRQKNEIRDAICAFSNDLPGHGRPGVVFVGLHDDGSCAGLAVRDALLRELADLRTDGNILPLPSMAVERRRVSGCEVAVIVVEPSSNPPVRVRGRTMIRVGSRRAVATVEEELRLAERARSKLRPFDVAPVHGATLADLDQDFLRRIYLPSAVAPEVLAENQRAWEAQLLALRILHDEQTPTVFGILVAGIDVVRFLPGAYVQFVRFAGTELSDSIVHEKVITGTVPEVVRRTEELFDAHIVQSVDLSGPVEVRRADYPLRALQELLRNAVLHRTYEGTNAPVHVRWHSDRVEILSPGGPFGKVTKDNFGQPGLSDLRNPHLAEALRHLGLAQRFGVGLELVRKALERNGNPPPDFDVTDTHVLVTVRRRP